MTEDQHSPAPSRSRIGSTVGAIGEVSDVSRKLAGVGVSIARRLTIDVVAQGYSVGKDALGAARAGKSTEEIASLVVSGWVDGAKRVLGVDEDLRKVGEQVSRLAPPASARPGKGASPGDGSARSAPATSASVEQIRLRLRERGHELLRRSNALDDPDEHPAMVSILEQLAPDEARILRVLAQQGPQALIDVVAYNPMTRRSREMLHHYSLIARQAGCIRPQNTGLYLDNLIRLGLAQLRAYRVGSQETYDLLQAQPELNEVGKPGGRLTRLRFLHHGIELSEFGTQFYHYCIGHDGERRNGGDQHEPL